jgi:Ca-activated chloride channel homolog
MRFVVDELRAADSLAITSFSEVATTALPLTRVTGPGRDAAVAAIDALHPGGGTSIAAGLAAGLAEVAATGTAKGGGIGCVILTDGLDDGVTVPRHAYGRYDAVIATARACKVPIFTLGFGSDHDAGVLAHLATSTGRRKHDGYCTC